MRIFPTWKTVTLGTHLRVEEYKAALHKQSIGIVAPVDDIVLATQEYPVELAYLTGLDVQLGGEIHRKDVYLMAKIFGLEVCPEEVALALPLLLAEEDRERIPFMIATDPRITTGGNPYVSNEKEREELFCIVAGQCGERMRIQSIIGSGECTFATPWVFMRGPRAI